MEVENITPNFYTVKLEEGDCERHNICHGCLSADRLLSPIRNNLDLFMYLMGGTLIESEYIYLCWECSAILKKMQIFRNRVQYAQTTLQQALYRENEIKCLSTISRVKLEPLLDIDDDTSPNIQFPLVNLEPLVITNNSETENDQQMSPSILTNEYIDEKNDLKDLELKEEDAEYDMPLEDIDYEQEIKEEMKDSDEKRDTRKRRLDGFYKIMKKYKNPNVDLDNYETCFFSDVLSVKEMENMGRTASKAKIGNNRFACRQCMKAFIVKIDLKRHNTFCHILKKSEGPFTCLECGARCPDRSSLEAHWSEHNAIQRCKECGKLASTPWAMKQHVVAHAYLWRCRLCPGLVVRSRRDIIYHYKTIHRRAICDYCGKQCESKHTMSKHIRNNHIPPECTICKTKFKNYYRLKSHCTLYHPHLVNKPTAKELAYCVECDKQYPSEAKYRLHLTKSVTHNPKVRQRNKKVPCPDCGKIFTRTSYMNNHYKLIHKKETDHYCALCNKYLVNAWAMKLHVKGVHQKIRQPKNKICDICRRAFSSNAILTRHRRTHTGERPYKCPHCPAAFTQRTPLVSHARTQHNAKV